jgi:hypothetical protein
VSRPAAELKAVRPIDPNTFGGRLFQVAAKNGGTPAFAKKLSMSDTGFRKWTHSKCEPSRSDLLQIARLGNVDLLWLITGSDSQDSALQQQLKDRDALIDALLDPKSGEALRRALMARRPNPSDRPEEQPSGERG